MSYNQIRLAGKHHRGTNQHPKPLAHRQSYQSIPSSRPQQQHLPELNPFNRSPPFDQHYSSGGHYATYPPVQILQREVDRFNDFRGSGQSRFGYGQISQTFKRADNRGYSSIQDQSQAQQSISTARFTYPPVQEMNRPRLYTEFHGSDAPSDFMCQPGHRSDNRDYSGTQDTAKRTKTEYGYHSTPRDYHPPLPPPRYPHVESPDRKVAAAPSGTDNFYSRQREVQGLSAVVSEEKTVQDDSSIKTVSSNGTQRPTSLALPEDNSHLTALHCFVRSHCVYIFCAEANEVDSKCITNILLFTDLNTRFSQVNSSR